MESAGNWVDQRSRRDKALADGVPNVWARIRSAIQNACDSYNKHYSKNESRPAVTCELDNGKRVVIRIRRRYPDRETSEELIVELKGDMIDCVADARQKPIRFESDEHGAFIKGSDGQKLSADEVSRLILEPFLFKNTE